MHHEVGSGVTVSSWSTAGYVPGLRIRISSAELASHLRARADYHEKRRDEKRELLPQIEEAAAKVKAQQPAAVVAQFAKSASNYRFDGDDAVESLKSDIDTHNNKSVAFRFLADHLFEQDYCLTHDDLVQLEITKRF